MPFHTFEKKQLQCNGSDWGLPIKSAIMVYRGYIESKARYGIATWYDGVTQKTRDAIDVILRRAIKRAIGLHLTASGAIAEDIAGLLTLDALRDCEALASFDRASRSPMHKDTVSALLGNECSYFRWADRKRNALFPPGLYDFPDFLSPSERFEAVLRANNVVFGTQTAENDEDLMRCAEFFKADYVLLSDGSVVDLTTAAPHEAAAGGGALLYRTQDGVVTWECSVPLGRGKCSYDSENGALSTGCRSAPIEGERPRVLIALDGQSTIIKLAGGSPDTRHEIEVFDAVETLAEKCEAVAVIHVRAHSGISLNERVDKLASIGSSVQKALPFSTADVSHKAVKSAYRREVDALRQKSMQATAAAKPGDTVALYLECCGGSARRYGIDWGPRRKQVIVNQIMSGRVTCAGKELDLDEFIGGVTCPVCGGLPKEGTSTFSRHLLSKCPCLNGVHVVHWPPSRLQLEKVAGALATIRTLGGPVEYMRTRSEWPSQ